MKRYLFPVLLIFLTECTSVKPIHEGKEARHSEMDNLAYANFGEKYAVKKNETGSHFIVFKKYKKLNDLFATVKFFIFEIESQSIIFKDELKDGGVSWTSDSQIIAVSRNLKTVTSTNNKPMSRYYYDVKTKIKKMD